MSGSPKLIVVYDLGSVSPTRLADVAADSGCELVFVTTGSPHSKQMAPILEHFGTLVDGQALSAADLASRLSRLEPAGIVTFSELQIALTSDLAARLDLPYHAKSDLEAILRKDRQRERFEAAGIATPRFAVVSDLPALDAALEHVGLPAIVKPRTGVSSRDTFLVGDIAECRRAVSDLLSPSAEGAAAPALMLEQPLVGRETAWPWGDYIAVDCLSTDGVVQPMFVTGKFSLATPFRERGGYGPAQGGEAELAEIEALAVQAVMALDIRHGVADVEIKLTDEGPRVIEVNGRLGGWVDDLASRSNGLSPAAVAVRSALGLECDLTERWRRIAFHYLVIPPVWAIQVRLLRGAEKLRAIPNVDHVSVYADVGGSASWRLGTASSVAAVIGTADTYEALEATIDRIEQTDWIEYSG